MVAQELIDAHAARIDALASEFESQITDEVETVVSAMSAHIYRSLTVSSGRAIEQTSANAIEIRLVDENFTRALNASSYHAVVQAFIEEFVNQIDEFRTFYEELRGQFGLPSMIISADDKAILIAQAGAAVAAIDAQTLMVMYNLRQLTARSLGGVDIDQLVQGISDDIRKLTKVGPMAKDQLIVFFRLVGSLVYKNVESAGYRLLYTYVGPTDEKNRDFCAALASAGHNYMRDEIDAMDNGQVPGVFENGGGYNCRHWFELVRA